MADFTELFFGMADAKNEAHEYPDEFMRSFVDHHGVVEGLRDGTKFLLLGPKGAGKSAVAWYLDKSAEGTDMLVSTRDISELPLAEVSNFKTGESGGAGRMVTAWRLIVLCALLDLVLEDQSSRIGLDPNVMPVVNELRRLGFMDPTPSRAIITASTKTLKIPIPTLGEVFSRETSTSLHLYHLVPYLQQWIAASGSHNAYRIILDGLDSIYLNDPSYLPTLTALVQAVYLVNQELRSMEAPSRVVLLVRNDVFTRLGLPDAGKMRADFGVNLDWRVLTGKPEKAPLFQMLNQKATSLLEEPVDVVSRFLPPSVTIGGTARGMPIHQYLLNLTRHTPRDLLQLFENLRQAATDLRKEADGTISQALLREGALRYANRYFVDAIRNELVGRSNSMEEATAGLNALRDLGRTQFTASEFAQERFGSEPSHEEWARAKEMLRWFFFAGAIGNVRAGTRESYVQFFHRRDDNDVYIKGPLTLHTALIYAWAIPRGSRGRQVDSSSQSKTAPRHSTTTGTPKTVAVSPTAGELSRRRRTRRPFAGPAAPES